MSRYIYSPTRSEAKKISKICAVLEKEWKRTISNKGQTEEEKSDALANIRFLKRMICAEGPMNFMNYFCGVKLNKKASEKIFSILNEPINESNRHNDYSRQIRQQIRQVGDEKSRLR
ncbi:MAG: hypothetical protein QW112_03090 [Candidatus Micrarchaeia archaeon]